MTKEEIAKKTLLHLSERLAKLSEDDDLLSVISISYSEERPLVVVDDPEGKARFVRDGAWILNISITDEVGEGGIIQCHQN